MASEAQHQAYVIKWSQQPSIRRQWPELALLHHIPNGGTRDAVGERLQAQGYVWRVCHGWQAAVAVLEWYLQL